MNPNDHLAFNLEQPFPTYRNIEFRRIRPTKQTAVEHICGVCGSGIPAGSPTLYFSGLTIELGFYYYHECQSCTENSQIRS